MKKKTCSGWICPLLVIGIAFFPVQPLFAKEFKSPEAGFSISFPDHFVIRKAPRGFLYAQPVMDPIPHHPWPMAAHDYIAENFPWLLVGTVEALNFKEAFNSFSKKLRNLRTENIRETVTADGTKAQYLKFSYSIHGTGGFLEGAEVSALAIGIQKEGRWAIASLRTVPHYFNYDETDFLDILKTLTFK